MPIDDETKRKIAASVTEREAMTEASPRIRGLIRVEIEATDGVHAIARSGGHEMHVDEPEERGGTNQGASPLAHFLTGIGT